MDPEARVSLTASDHTASAFASADRNLRGFASSANSLRSLLRSFGVVLSVRAFAGWIQGAMDAKNMTDEQRESVREAKAAFESFKSASDDLARSLATSLAPAIEGVAHLMTGLNAAFFGASPFAFEKQANDLAASINVMKQQLASSGGMPKTFLDDLRVKIAAAEAELERLKQKQFGVLTGGPRQLEEIDVGAIRALRTEAMKSFPGIDVSKGQKLSPELAEFIDQLEEGASLTEKMRTDVEKQVDEWHRVQELFTAGAISGETMTRFRDSLLEPIEVTAKRMKQVKDDVGNDMLDWARSLGNGMRSAFADWLADGEFDFRDFLKRMAAEFAASELFRALGSIAGGSGGGGGPWSEVITSIFGGKRAMGGPVAAGTSYLVGERGPEIFTPRTAGRITPNGGSAVMVNVNVQAGLPPQWAAQLLEAGQMTAQAVHEAVLNRLNGRR